MQTGRSVSSVTRVWQHYDVAVWSSGGCDWVEGAVAKIMVDHPQPLFVWSAGRCTRRVEFEPYYREFQFKNLKKLWKRFDKNRMLIVDDSPEKCFRNSGSAVMSKSLTANKMTRNCSTWLHIWSLLLAMLIFALWKSAAGATSFK